MIKQILVFTVCFLLIALQGISSATELDSTLNSTAPPSTPGENAIIMGYVTDAEMNTAYSGALVEIFYSDHTEPLAITRTDYQGYYKFDIPPERGYDIYARVGEMPTMQSVYVSPGQIQTVNFKISVKKVTNEQFTEDIGFRVVVIVAVVILLIILIDQIYLRKRREIKELDKERQKLEEKMGTSGEAPDLRFTGREGELMGLKKEKTQFEYMINLTNIKYHTRKLDEESFREIVRDYQKKLIEIEIKIKELEREKEKSRE